ncbi:trophoblast-specific protein alpha-like [Cricetulus griseus]|uniref:Trophoblast-specific protein alpha-like n=1 Tax=Cricetulus griseus TaxID=10029 RepID=A0A9J7GUP8_CRIGR|nr:trophoblast-specific protein alpha-like [Cricetulus griseus]XP_035293483.1 trophoblast-specific protein alpha-like [Cricetulus griseus]XP_035297445.1 trophoblast-specific protein alpha-like [Cricetulus griseus]
MTPAVFLAILCLAVTSAAESSEPILDAEHEDQPIKNEQDREGYRRQIWEEFMKKVELYYKKNAQKNDSLNTEMEDIDDFENDQNTDSFNIEMEDFNDLTDAEFKNLMDKILFPMFGEEEKDQPAGDDDPKLEDLSRSDDVTPVQD